MGVIAPRLDKAPTQALVVALLCCLSQLLLSLVEAVGKLRIHFSKHKASHCQARERRSSRRRRFPLRGQPRLEQTEPKCAVHHARDFRKDGNPRSHRSFFQMLFKFSFDCSECIAAEPAVFFTVVRLHGVRVLSQVASLRTASATTVALCNLSPTVHASSSLSGTVEFTFVQTDGGVDLTGQVSLDGA